MSTPMHPNCRCELAPVPEPRPRPPMTPELEALMWSVIEGHCPVEVVADYVEEQGGDPATCERIRRPKSSSHS